MTDLSVTLSRRARDLRAIARLDGQALLDPSDSRDEWTASDAQEGPTPA